MFGAVEPRLSNESMQELTAVESRMKRLKEANSTESLTKLLCTTIEKSKPNFLIHSLPEDSTLGLHVKDEVAQADCVWLFKYTLLICQKLRRISAPHTCSLPLWATSCWDMKFTTVLLYSLFRAHPSAKWNRMVTSVLRNDLLDTEPYDGSTGIVCTLYESSSTLPVQLVDVVEFAGRPIRRSLRSSIAGADAARPISYGAGELIGPSTNTPRCKTMDVLLEALLDRSTVSVSSYAHKWKADTVAVSGVLQLSGSGSEQIEPSLLGLSDMSMNGWTIMHFLASQSGTASSKAKLSLSFLNKIVRILITEGVRLAEQDMRGCTPLHIACSCLHLDMILCLISQGALTTVRNRTGETPLLVFARALTLSRFHRDGCNDVIIQGIIESIIALTGNDISRLWGETSSSEDSDAEHTGSSFQDISSRPFAKIISGCEETICKTIIARSKMCMPNKWDIEVIHHCIMNAVKSGKAWLVESLWNSFEMKLLPNLEDCGLNDDVFQEIVMREIGFMQACICAAAIKGAGTKTNSAESKERTGQATLTMLQKMYTKAKSRVMKLPNSAENTRKLQCYNDIFDKTLFPFLHVAILGCTSSKEILEGLLSGDFVTAAHILKNCNEQSSVHSLLYSSDHLKFWLPFPSRPSVRSASEFWSKFPRKILLFGWNRYVLYPDIEI